MPEKVSYIQSVSNSTIKYHMTSNHIFFVNMNKMLSKFTHFSSTMLVVIYFCQWDSLDVIIKSNIQRDRRYLMNVNDTKYYTNKEI